MKKAIYAVFVAVVMAFSCAGAQAQTVVGSDGVKVLGLDSSLAISKEPTSACGSTYCAKVLYSSGWQYLVDDAAHTKYGKLASACGSACLSVDNDTNGLVIAVGRSNGTYCISSKSTIAFPNSGAAVEVADSCAYWQKVKANSQ